MYLGNVSLSILIMAMDLLILLDMCFTWACQLSLLSSITPRNLVSVLSCIMFPSILRLDEFGFPLFVNTIIWVFCKLIMSLLAFSHSMTLANSFVNFSSVSLRVRALHVAVESSANKLKNRSALLIISLI